MEPHKGGPGTLSPLKGTPAGFWGLSKLASGDALSSDLPLQGWLLVKTWVWLRIAEGYAGVCLWFQKVFGLDIWFTSCTRQGADSGHCFQTNVDPMAYMNQTQFMNGWGVPSNSDGSLLSPETPPIHQLGLISIVSRGSALCQTHRALRKTRPKPSTGFLTEE